MSSDRASITPTNDAVYQQLYEQLRAKDDVSFKLLSLVPLISGAGISILIKIDLTWGLKCFVSSFGATVTFCIFRWELRSIRWRDWLLKRANEIENVVAPSAPEIRISPQRRVAVGKTEAETILCLTVTLAWLVLPGLDAFMRLEEKPGVAGAAVALAVGVVLGAWTVLTTTVDWKDMFKRECVPPKSEELRGHGLSMARPNLKPSWLIAFRIRCGRTEEAIP